MNIGTTNAAHTHRVFDPKPTALPQPEAGTGSVTPSNRDDFVKMRPSTKDDFISRDAKDKANQITDEVLQDVRHIVKETAPSDTSVPTVAEGRAQVRSTWQRLKEMSANAATQTVSKTSEWLQWAKETIVSGASSAAGYVMGKWHALTQRIEDQNTAKNK